MKISRTGIIASALPGLLAVGLFYSLAIHMYRSLGKWPSSIGEAGFSPALLAHATIATGYFWILLPLSILTLPIATLVCLLVSRWRPLVPYFVLYAAVFAICIGIMQLAPDAFLYWWRD